jgi:hypothetical protein
MSRNIQNSTGIALLGHQDAPSQVVDIPLFDYLEIRLGKHL